MRQEKKTIKLLLSALLSVALLAANAWSEPLAPMPKMTAEGRELMKSQGKTMADVEKEIPTKSEVGVPVYPGALYATHVSAAAEGMLPSVSLVSDDPPEQVNAWYRKNLNGYAFHDQFDLFYEAPDGETLSMSELTSVPTVSVMEEDGQSMGLMFSVVPNVKTRIIISYREK